MKDEKEELERTNGKVEGKGGWSEGSRSDIVVV